jgi:prepilin-type N-terminal cleavage/methylation domain-containing protein
MAHRDRDGFTLIELLLVVAIIGIIAAIAAPGLLRARMAGNEASAIGSMRAISTAQHAYAGKCNGYAPVLTELSLAGSFLSPDMTSGPVLSKSGYTITLTAGAANLVLPSLSAGCTGSGSSYIATAVPMSIGTSGTRGFATDEGGAIWQDVSGAAPAQPFTTGGNVSIIQ